MGLGGLQLSVFELSKKGCSFFRMHCHLELDTNWASWMMVAMVSVDIRVNSGLN